jgi:hypothetical protein
MTDDPFDKDGWFLRAVAAGVVRVEKDGVILRPGKFALKEIPLQTHKKTGRVYFNLTFENITKSMLVNRALALVYLPNPNNWPQVNHINGVKGDNWVEHPTKLPKCNLEWSSKSANEKHAFATGLKSNRGSANGNAKVTPDQVRMIRQAPADTLADIAHDLRVSMKTVMDIREERTWRHL